MGYDLNAVLTLEEKTMFLREVQRKCRQKEFKVVLVGYTNAGKSTLLKALSGAEIYIADQLFATLDTTIRTVEIDSTHTFLLSDTIGFIRKLPHHLIASFHSTLKETTEADLLAIVLDGSSRSVMEHYRIIRDVLKEIHADKVSYVVVFNKLDQMDDKDHFEFLRNKFSDGIFISAQHYLGLDSLLENIRSAIEETYLTTELFIPYKNGKHISSVQEGVEVLSKISHDKGMHFKIKGNRTRIEQLRKMVKEKPSRITEGVLILIQVFFRTAFVHGGCLPVTANFLHPMINNKGKACF